MSLWAEHHPALAADRQRALPQIKAGAVQTALPRLLGRQLGHQKAFFPGGTAILPLSTLVLLLAGLSWAGRSGDTEMCLQGFLHALSVRRTISLKPCAAVALPDPGIAKACR